ncbi:hypothetical protein SAMN04488700_1618 [Carnobacterium iners]|uniref:Uncharacterized protein n=1 Tax=Carnobacterium iners TaxID=1073423 RepID=A0A1X7N900_9LACT|nr:hypothetical protein SAMN04488114_12425 [Carnobacterium iners]SMH34036.1 hypothetical protein SAMN04488700_1618 [Carnobacterium iners]
MIPVHVGAVKNIRNVVLTKYKIVKRTEDRLNRIPDETYKKSHM